MNKIKRFFNKIEQVIYFIPIIWKGWDWDYRYSLELFKHQLKRQAKFLDSPKAYGVDSEQRAKKIRTAVKLLDLVYEQEKYALEYQDKLQEEYGENVLDWHFIRTENSEFSELKYEYQFWDNAEEIRRREQKLFKESMEKQQKAEKLVWKYIGHNIRGWWD